MAATRAGAGPASSPKDPGRILDELEASSDYKARRQAVLDWNGKGGVIRKGIALRAQLCSMRRVTQVRVLLKSARSWSC